MAVRDNNSRAVVTVEHVTPENAGDAFGKARKQYPPPGYEVVIATAPTVEAFMRNYPRFECAEGGEGK